MWAIGTLTLSIHKKTLISTIHDHHLVIFIQDLLILNLFFTIFQILKQRLSRCHPRLWWQQIDSCVRFVERDFKGIKTFSFIGEVITCHGNWSKEQAKKFENEFTCARRSRVSITIRQGHLETLLVSRNISAGSMARRSGSVPSALSVMQFSRIGKLIPKPVGQENTSVIAALFFQGNFFFFFHFHHKFKT